MLHAVVVTPFCYLHAACMVRIASALYDVRADVFFVFVSL